MKSETQIKVDLAHPSLGTRVEAMQGDGNTRCITVQLLDDGKPWHPPADVEIAVAYTQPGGTKGFYNQLPDGSPAVRVNGSRVTILLASAMLQVPGRVSAAVVFNNSQLDQLTSFPFTVTVTESPYVGAQQAEDYIRLQWLENKLDAWVQQMMSTEKAVAAGIAAERADAAAVTAREQVTAADTAATAANTAAAGANLAKITAETAAVAAQAQASAAEIAAGNANAAAQGADTARDAANAAADTANQAAAAAQRVVDTVAPDVLQLKQTAAIHENALDNRIKKFYTNNLGGTFIADSDDGAVQNLVVYGKSEQAATTGAQVLSYAAKTETRSGVTFTVHDDGTVTAKGTAEETIWFPLFTQDDFTLKSGQYTLRANFSGKSVGTSRLQLENKDGFYQSENSFTITEDTPITGHLKVYEGESVDFTCKPMLNSGSIAHEWEPYTGGMPSPSPGYPQEIKATANPVMLLVSDNQSCSAAVPYTLNAIPVSSGGNVTIDGQQYIADYVDVENGCIVRNVVAQVWTGEEAFSQLYDRQGVFQIKSEDYGLPITGFTASPTCLLCDTFPPTTRENVVDKLAIGIAIYYTNMICIYPGPDLGTVDAFKAYLSEHPVCFMCKRSTPVFESIPDDQIAGLKSLRTYYGGTNITFATENGVEPAVHFDYACSLENFVEYIKAAQGDDRKFIYDMDERMTDAEYMAAMAYVNSEYAAALTELEG